MTAIPPKPQRRRLLKFYQVLQSAPQSPDFVSFDTINPDFKHFSGNQGCRVDQKAAYTGPPLLWAYPDGPNSATAGSRVFSGHLPERCPYKTNSKLEFCSLVVQTQFFVTKIHITVDSFNDGISNFDVSVVVDVCHDFRF